MIINNSLTEDKTGNVQRFNSNSEDITRSKASYHPSVITKKNNDFRFCLKAKTSKEIKAYEYDMVFSDVNKDSEAQLLRQIQENLTEISLSKILCFSLCDLEMFDELKDLAFASLHRYRI